MKNFIKQLKNLTYYDWLVAFFPISLLLRSAITNLYISILGIIFVFNYFRNKNLFKNIDFKWAKFFFIFYFYILIRSFFSENAILSIQSSFFQIRFILFSLFIYTCASNIKNFFTILKIYFIMIREIQLDY
jgi:hypothetical protein